MNTYSRNEIYQKSTENNKWLINDKFLAEHLRDGKINQSVIEDKYNKLRTTSGRIEELVTRQYQDNQVKDHWIYKCDRQNLAIRLGNDAAYCR